MKIISWDIILNGKKLGYTLSERGCDEEQLKKMLIEEGYSDKIELLRNFETRKERLKRVGKC